MSFSFSFCGNVYNVSNSLVVVVSCCEDEIDDVGDDSLMMWCGSNLCVVLKSCVDNFGILGSRVNVLKDRKVLLNNTMVNLGLNVGNVGDWVADVFS